MTIPVTTRTAKGSPLTTAEMDTNLTNLAREAIQSTAGDDQGNVELADEAVTEALVDPVRPVVPEHLGAGVQAYLDSQIDGTDNIIANDGSWTEPTTGLIFKWGNRDDVQSSTTVTFAAAFPTAIFQVFATYSNFKSGTNIAIQIGDAAAGGNDPTVANFVAFLGTDVTHDIAWLAIGN